MWRWGVSGCALAAALLAGSAAWGQATAPSDPPPPLGQSIDANGVDVISGALKFSASQASIGPSGAALTRAQENFTAEDNFYGAINSSGSTYTVSLGGASEAFTLSNGVFTSVQKDGSSLAYNTQSSPFYVYTMSDGTVVQFSTAVATANPVQANVAQIVKLIRPTGETLTYNYTAYQMPYNTPQKPLYRNTYWFSGVTSNRGLQIQYSYNYTFNGYYTSPPVLSSIQGINLAQNSSAGGTYTVSGSKVTDPLGRVTNFGPAAAGYNQTIIKPSGAQITVAYDSSARVTSYSNGVGTWNYAYSVSGTTETTTVTDPNGNKKTYVSNLSTDVLTSYTDALGRVTTYSYTNSNATQQLTSVTHPHGDVMSYAYDARGNVSSTTWTPSGGGTAITTQASYDSTCSYPAKCNKPNTTTDAKGAVTNYTYDNNTGVLLTVTRPAGANGVQPQTRYSYTAETASGQSSSILLLTGVSTCNTQSASQCIGSADETRTTISYNPNANLAPSSVTVAAGDGSISSTQSFTYDALGNLATSTSPLGAVTTYLYDADRELTGVVGPDPDGSGPLTPSAVRLSYNADGKLTYTEAGTVNSASSSDWANFNSVVQQGTGYDGIDRVGYTWKSGGGTTWALTQYSFDAANQLTCAAVRMNPAVYSSLPYTCNQSTNASDGPDRITQFSYNADGSVATVASGVGTAQQRNLVHNYYNNADGSLIDQVDANNNTTCYGYDGFGRKGYTTYPDPSTRNCDSNSSYENYAYDANGNLTSKRQRDGAVIAYSYDALNRLTSNGDTSYAYDLQGRVTDANNTSSALGLSSGLTLHFAYDALGRKVQEAGSFGGVTTSSYDAAGDRIRLSWPDGHAASYSYDSLGRITSISMDGATSGPGLLAGYNYDSLGRLQHASLDGSVLGLGVLYSSNGLPGITGYGFADSSKNMQSWTNFNAAGQVNRRDFTNDGYDWTFTYGVLQGYGINGLNQVTSAGSTNFSYDNRGLLSSDGTNSYLYTRGGSQLYQFSGGYGTVNLGYDGLHRLAQTQGSATTRFTYDGGSAIEEQDGSGNILRRYVPGADGSPLVWYEGSDTSNPRWLFKDLQGSVIAVANSAGQSVATNTYDAYGMPGPNNVGRFQYAGYMFVPEVGLYNTGARTYSPTLGRFLQTDPIGYGDGMNWYAYTHGDPVNGIDPSGLDDQVPPVQSGPGAESGGGGDQVPYPGQCPGSVCGTPVPVCGGCDAPPSPAGVSGATVTSGGGGGGLPGKPPKPQPQNVVQEVVVTAKKARSLFGCASEFASNHSISSVLQLAGVNPFVADVIGGNTISGLHDIASSFVHGSGGGNSFAYNLAQAGVAGPALGTGAFFAKQFPKLAEATGGVPDVLEALAFGAEAASGIGEAKAIFDVGSFAAGGLYCLAGGGG